jgi:hypothetical protein
LGNKGKWEYLRAIYERYQAAGRKSKKVILNEFCTNTGYNRKYAIRLLNGPRLEKRRRPRMVKQLVPVAALSKNSLLCAR